MRINFKAETYMSVAQFSLSVTFGDLNDFAGKSLSAEIGSLTGSFEVDISLGELIPQFMTPHFLVLI